MSVSAKNTEKAHLVDCLPIMHEALSCMLSRGVKDADVYTCDPRSQELEERRSEI